MSVSEVLEIRKLAHEYVQNGELDKALAEYGKLLKKESVDPNIFNLMGDVYYKRGSSEEAFKHYNEAVKRYGTEGLYSNAIAVCRKMLRLDPEYLDATRMLGELYLEQSFTGEAIGYFLEYAEKLASRNDMENAAEALKKVIETAPGRVNVREKLAEVYAHLGLADEARSELIAASDIYRDKGDVVKSGQLRSRADELGGGGDIPEAEVTTEGEEKDRVEVVHKRIGLAHHVPLSVDEILTSFREEVKRAIGEEDYQSHYDMGISYLDLGFYDEALAEFGVARRSPELELKSIEMAGKCFMEKGDIELAIEELEAAMCTSDIPEEDCLGLKYNLAEAYDKIGQPEKAIRLYQQIHETDENYRDVTERIGPREAME
jgi:tetratricopeptide (TPR) repeat protein